MFIQDGQYCVVDVRQDAPPVCLARVYDTDARWLDDDSLLLLANAGEDQPQIVAAEVPASTTTILWSLPGPPLFHDLSVREP